MGTRAESDERTPEESVGLAAAEQLMRINRKMVGVVTVVFLENGDVCFGCACRPSLDRKRVGGKLFGEIADQVHNVVESAPELRAMMERERR